MRATDTDTTSAKAPPQPIKGIAGNAGKEKTIFTDTHPFFKNTTPDGKEQLQKAWRKMERKRVRVWARENIQGKVFNSSEGEIHITGIGIKEIINQNHDYYWEKNQLLFDIKKVIKKAKLIGFVPYKKSPIAYANVHYYKFELSGELSYLNVFEKKNGKLFLYSITDKVTESEIIN